MKQCLMVPFLAFIAAACTSNAKPPKNDGGVDASIDTAAPPVDAAPDLRAPDTGIDTAPDSPADGRQVADAAPDRAPDVVDVRPPLDTAPDTAPDTTAVPDAGVVTCGPGASREMLCATYCDGMTRICTGANAQYASAAQCRTACNATTWACGDPGDTMGNSLFCRLAHMALAGVGVAAMECPNAGPNSPTCQ
jgi:hypothetical protein